MTDPADVGRVLAERGPLTGAELHAAVGGEVFGLWKACVRAPGVATRVIGRRYVRLDRTVEGFARLSPSILREFMTYTVVGLPGREGDLDRAARRLQARTKAISKGKLRVATRFAAEVFGGLAERGVSEEDFCVLIAGDVVYDMSHDVVRRESSTGGRVDGSDLDLVVLAGDHVAPEAVDAVDAAIMARKWLYLRNPASREEVDYVVKRLSRLAEQTAFDTFPHMVACKVFDEARYVRGNAALHEAGRRLLAERGIVEQLRDLEAQAIERRAAREEYLLGVAGDRLPVADQPQFFNDDEAAEFEHPS